ncbi:hypothetical protein [Paraliobacillus zengyii]|uniref:hypothetical protein n=1 Tax=Paraliobacillus zengyii TaxID=2213194 RepID=UPI0013A6B048|nr:hypothetical protein [Paraliobacillus zengyii]
MKIYKTDIYSDDISIKNLMLINSNKELFIPGTYIVEKNTDKEIRDVGIFLEYGEKTLIDWVFQFDHLNSVKPPSDGRFTKVYIKRNDTITVKIFYTINDKEQIISRDIKVADILLEH